MTTKTLVQTENVTLQYHTDGRIVHHVIHKPTQGKEFRDLLTTGAELFERQKAVKWLSDDRGNGALHPDDSDWAMGVWSARVVKAGWKYWAVVMPKAALGKMNMKRFINLYRDFGVEVRIFEDDAPALEWLKNVDRSTRAATES